MKFSGDRHPNWLIPNLALRSSFFVNRRFPFSSAWAAAQLCALALLLPAAAAAELQALCTTFPIYQITRNVVRGRAGAEVRLLLPASLGCPHDHALAPQDLRQLAGASVLVVNGLGLEEFLDAPLLARINPGLAVVDSSAGVSNLLSSQSANLPGQGAVNPHLFTSPRLAARLAATIAAGLAKADPEGAALYLQNAAAYAARMNRLAEDFAALVKTLRNPRIVTQHGVFDYLARETGLEVAAAIQTHAGREPSAAEMLATVKTIRARKAGAIFTEPQYPAKIGAALASETGIPCAILDPAATGPDNAPLDYYETVMRKNMETLRATLGVRTPPAFPPEQEDGVPAPK